MGYSTDYSGVLKFTNELKASEIAHLKQFLGEDIREHEEWEKNEWSKELYYGIDLDFTDKFDGLEWDGSEKSSAMVEQVNYLISQMRKVKLDFGLTGEFLCQGEDHADRWKLFINKKGLADSVDFPRIGDKITCPHCEEEFILEEPEGGE